MRILLFAFFTATILVACDESRVYEKNVDFDQRFWAAQDTAEYEFQIADNNVNYNLYCDIRNSVSYPWSRIFFNYSLVDSNGVVLAKKLTEKLLFDPKTGKPEGSSGLGDIYDHRIKVIDNFKFPGPGKYKMKFDQATRSDSLQGILAVGLRVEKVVEN